MPNGDYRVQSNRGWCDCGKFQAFRMRFSHVITTCSYARQDASKHLSDVYKVVNIFNIYNNSFLVVALEDYWLAYQGDIIWHNENMRWKKRVAPKAHELEQKWIRMIKR